MDIQRIAFQWRFAVDHLCGTQCHATQLYGTFGHGIQVSHQCCAEAIQHFMNGNKVCTAHIPVGLFGDQRKIDELDHLAIQQLNRCFFVAVRYIVTGIKQIRRFRFHQFSGTHNLISS